MIERGISPSLDAVSPKGETIAIFRTHNEDGSIKEPGIRIRQTSGAPADGVLMHPFVFGQLLNLLSETNSVIDIFREA